MFESNVGPAGCADLCVGGLTMEADLTGCSPALGVLTGRYNSILLTNSEKPFRGAIRWGGEDSCGGF